jgi:hypothetical protein
MASPWEQYRGYSIDELLQALEVNAEPGPSRLCLQNLIGVRTAEKVTGELRHLTRALTQASSDLQHAGAQSAAAARKLNAFTLVLATATVLLAVVSGLQFWQTKRQADVSEKQLRQQVQPALSSDCMVRGMQGFDRYKASLGERYDLAEGGFVRPPEFHFNGHLNTCLMRVGHWSFLRGSRPHGQCQDSDLLDEVVDVYSNTTLISDGHENRCGPCPPEQPTCMGGDMTTTPLGLDNPKRFSDEAKKLMTE